MYKNILLGLVCIFCVSSSWAGTTTATINRILIYEGASLIYVYPNASISNPPGCHGSNGDYYSFSYTRPMAEAYLNALLAAQARGVPVQLTGEGMCIDQSVSETLRYFRIES
jgi:hypothetical protein